MKRYGVILADPAWTYSNSGPGINGAANKHYETMTNAEIVDLNVEAVAAETSVLLLWSTWPFLEVAIRDVIPSWGFEFVTGFPWIKLTQGLPRVSLFGELELAPAYGSGWWIRGCSEPLLIARRGRPERPSGSHLGLLSDVFSSGDEVGTTGLISPRFEHSRKPDNVYQIAESLPGPYLEMNARRRRRRWDVWGHIEGSIELPHKENKV